MDPIMISMDTPELYAAGIATLRRRYITFWGEQYGKMTAPPKEERVQVQLAAESVCIDIELTLHDLYVRSIDGADIPEREFTYDGLGQTGKFGYSSVVSGVLRKNTPQRTFAVFVLVAEATRFALVEVGVKELIKGSQGSYHGDRKCGHEIDCVYLEQLFKTWSRDYDKRVGIDTNHVLTEPKLNPEVKDKLRQFSRE
mmetsp:Transcript_49724/g.116128  ORF Transcript_49724/g.116128 Transcript_49724/m.116128 type:complete len:198 (+) Transcript_49724:132-725(+)